MEVNTIWGDRGIPRGMCFPNSEPLVLTLAISPWLNTFILNRLIHSPVIALANFPRTLETGWYRPPQSQQSSPFTTIFCLKNWHHYELWLLWQMATNFVVSNNSDLSPSSSQCQRYSKHSDSGSGFPGSGKSAPLAFCILEAPCISLSIAPTSIKRNQHCTFPSLCFHHWQDIWRHASLDSINII